MSEHASTSGRINSPNKETRFQMRDRKAQKEGSHCTMYLPSGEQYKGEFQDNKRHGKGVVTYKNGDKYEGDWQDGYRHGNGTLWVFRDGKYYVRYSGDWDQDLPHGNGKFFDEAGNSYEGEWQQGSRHGRGRSVTGGRPVDGFGGDVYEGSWERDMKHGNGTLMLANGDMYEGEWAHDLKHGQGTYFYMNKGRRYDGLWQEGVAKCGNYSEVQPTAPGQPGSIPNVELVNPTAVLQDGAASALGLTAQYVASVCKSATDGAGCRA